MAMKVRSFYKGREMQDGEVIEVCCDFINDIIDRLNREREEYLHSLEQNEEGDNNGN